MPIYKVSKTVGKRPNKICQNIYCEQNKFFTNYNNLLTTGLYFPDAAFSMSSSKE